MTGIDGIRRLLLVSNSTLHGSGYLDHAEKEIRELVGSGNRVLFVPYAVHDLGAYAIKAEERFRDMGLSLISIHDVSNMPRAVEEADAIFVGGGNTFRLLKGLHRRLSNSENDQRHACRATSVFRGVGFGPLSD